MKAQTAVLDRKGARLAIAAVAGGTAWWLTKSAVAWWWAFCPLLTVATVLATRRREAGSCLWYIVTLASFVQLIRELVIMNAPALTNFLQLVLLLLFTVMSGAACLLALSGDFPRQTMTLAVWQTILAALLRPAPSRITATCMTLFLATGIAVTAAGKIPRAEARRAVPLLITALLLLATVIVLLPADQTPVQRALGQLARKMVEPGRNAAPATPSPPATAAPQEASGSSSAPASPALFSAPLLQAWLHALENTVLPWAVPLTVGLLAVFVSLIFLGHLKTLPRKWRRRALLVPLGILAIIIAIVLASASLKLNPAAAQRIQQFLGIRGTSVRTAGRSPGNAKPGATTIPLPAALQTTGAVVMTIAVAAMVIATTTVLLTAVREARRNVFQSIPDPQERRRAEKALRHMVSLEDTTIAADPRDAVIALFYLAMIAVQKLGLELVCGETPAELNQRVRAFCPAAGAPFSLIVFHFYPARYSEHRITPAAALASRDAYRNLLALLRASGKAAT